MSNRSHSHWLWSSLDLLVVVAAIVAYVNFQTLDALHEPPSDILAILLTPKTFALVTSFLFLSTSIHKMFGLYATRYKTLRMATTTAIVATSVGSASYLLFPLFRQDRTHSTLLTLLIFLCVSALLSILIVLFCGSIEGGAKISSLLVVGSGPLALKISMAIIGENSTGHDLIGFIDSPGSHAVPLSIQHRLIGTLENLEQVLMSTHVDEVVIALPLGSCYDQIQDVILICERIGVPVTYHYQPFVHNIGHSQISKRTSEPYITHQPSRIKTSYGAKRTLDIVVSACALLALAPILTVVAVAIRLSSRGPIVFKQQRYGLNRSVFEMYKFRTMVADAESRQAALEEKNEAHGPVFKIKHDPRVTQIGRLLRKTSLDELPQLVNVLKGEMSLVGPRPLPRRDFARFRVPAQMRRFSVKPGLTCLWQVRGRSNTTFDQWIAYDLEYIDTWSPLKDLGILLMTIPAIIRGNGAM